MKNGRKTEIWVNWRSTASLYIKSLYTLSKWLVKSPAFTNWKNYWALVSRGKSLEYFIGQIQAFYAAVKCQKYFKLRPALQP